jgi:hypothetical protein
VEIEVAMTFPGLEGDAARLGFLQVRPMVAPESAVDIQAEELVGPDVLASSERVMGNGLVESIRDVVYLLPETFDPKFSRVMAREIEGVNQKLVQEGRPYLLVGFGRWGSSDPWLGVPVTWSQVSGAKVIVEASLPDVNVDPSQGSHFFHNLTSFEVSYFTLRNEAAEGGMDWAWLARQEVVEQTEHLRHVRLADPLRVKVDGRTGRGVIEKGGEAGASRVHGIGADHDG